MNDMKYNILIFKSMHIWTNNKEHFDSAFWFVVSVLGSHFFTRLGKKKSEEF